MARARDRTDGREREREEAEERRPAEDLAVSQSGLNASETAKLRDRRVRFLDEFLPDFLDLELGDGVMPVLSMQLEHTGDGFTVAQAGGSAGSPAGAAGRTTTTNQSGSPVQVASYQVPGGKTANLEEVAAVGDDGGRVQFDVGGTIFGPLDAETAPVLSFNGPLLQEGDQVIVEAFTESGNSREFNAEISVREL